MKTVHLGALLAVDFESATSELKSRSSFIDTATGTSAATAALTSTPAVSGAHTTAPTSAGTASAGWWQGGRHCGSGCVQLIPQVSFLLRIRNAGIGRELAILVLLWATSHLSLPPETPFRRVGRHG